MSSKKKRTGPIVTKGRLSRWQRERRLRRIAIIAGCAVIVIVLAVAGYGYYDSAIAPYHQTILKVGDTTFDMNYYIEMLRLNGIWNADKSSQQQYIAQYTLKSIERNEMLRQLASDLGIAVSKKEIKGKIHKKFSPSKGTGENSVAPQDSISYKEYVQKLKGMGVPEELFRKQISASLLQKKLRKRIGEERVPEEMKQVHAKAIMLEDKGNLRKVQGRLGKGGNFSTLAKEFSKDSSSKDGGDLGWMPREIMAMRYPKKVVNKAFNLTAGEVSKPIEIDKSSQQNGKNSANKEYWIIKVMEREKRKLKESDRQTLQDQAFRKWFSKKRKKFDIEEHLSPELQKWAIEEAAK